MGSEVRFFRGLLIAVPISLGLWTALISGCSAITRTPTEVRVAGFLDETARADFAGAMPAPLVVLDSDGGLVASAAQMAGLIRAAGAATRVDGQCTSGCALLYAAGVRRSVALGGRVGVHRSDAGPVVDAAMGDLMVSFGTPELIVSAMLATPNESIHWLTVDELSRWNRTK